jgi:GT2 family glycosyltransferase
MTGGLGIKCSIVIPVHNQAALTRQCLEALLGEPSTVSCEMIVVDDASTDTTAELLSGYTDGVRVVSRRENGGFAAACNDGAAAAGGEYLVFLNNDTIPTAGWLDTLVAHAEGNGEAAAVGAKLLFPNETVQHAGVVICQDRLPRHLYVGFPKDHPATSKSRRFQVVTAACMLVRRAIFERVDGFDSAFRNSLEDADLCLRLGELGHEVHYCHQSVLYHLESVSRGKRSDETEHNIRLFRSRWQDRVKPDELDYYKEDGLLRFHYGERYPLRLEVSPEVATIENDGRAAESERLLDASSRQVLDLLKETVRLTVHAAGMKLADTGAEPQNGPQPQPNVAGHAELLRRAREIEQEIADLQDDVATLPGQNESFGPAEYLRYRTLLGKLRGVARAELPPGATVVVISKGDEELLDLGVRRAWHFPQDEQGGYAGHYPESSATAIAQLEELRNRGAEYLLVPATASWWLDRYPGFGQHLRSSYTLVVDASEVCSIYSLGATGT